MTDPLQSKLDALREVAAGLGVLGDTPHPPGEREFRWRELDQQLQGQAAGARVLVVGSGVDDDAVAFASRGASYVLAFGPPDAAQRLGGPDADGLSGIDFQSASWQELDPARHGTFTIVHCHGLFHRVTEPLALLRTLRLMTAPGGTLLISSMMISDPERSEYLRFVPDRYAGDPTWWFIPGRLAFRWMVHTAGFEVIGEFAEREGPRDLFRIIAGYLRATAP